MPKSTTTYELLTENLREKGVDQTLKTSLGWGISTTEFNSRLAIALEMFINTRQVWCKDETIERLNSKI